MKKTQTILQCTGLAIDKPIVYILRGEQGDLLIDTGTRQVTHQIDRWILRNHFNIKWIFLTHGHFDHTWNARYFKQKYNADVILHEKDRALFCEGEHFELFPSSEKTVRITAVSNKFAAKFTAPFCRVDKFISDGETDFLRSLGFDADIVMLPGHTEGSMGILQGRVLYAGDSVSAKGGDYYTAMFGENVKALLESEKKIFELNPLIIAPGHGHIIINERAF